MMGRVARHRRLMKIGRQLLEELGEDPAREGLRETPDRWARMWLEFVDFDAGNTGTVFRAEGTDQMVVVGGIRVWSMCEHHLLPFYCDVAIGYIAGNRILGLSKFARIAQAHAHKLQVQERLVEAIATEVREVTEATDVAVLAVGELLCMVMRGARTPHRMVSSALHGQFRQDMGARSEFYTLAKLGGLGDLGPVR